MKLKPQTELIFNWYEVMAAFAEHSNMSFDSYGCWGLDFSKLAGEPDFKYHRVLRYEQDYLYPMMAQSKEFCEGDLQKILEKSEAKKYQDKTYYSIPFGLVVKYLIYHGILPEKSFFITNVSIS